MSAPSRENKAKDFYLRDLSGGMNLSTGRESIADNEAWWMEGLQPVAPGNLAVMPHALTTGFLVAEASTPSYAMSFQALGTTYIFVVFSNTGNGYVGAIGGAFTQIFTGTLTSGFTCAAQWNKQGILIVDPAGYWDWNVTTAVTLTSLNNSVQSLTIEDPGASYTSTPTITFAGGGGSGAAATAYLGINNVAVAAGGTNYKVGDIVAVLGANAISLGTCTVTTISAGGVVTALSVTTAGQYIPGGIPTAGAACIGGAGNALTVNPLLGVSVVTVTARGSGYTSTPTATLVGGGSARAGSLLVIVSGSLAGSCIASYAGRAWIANARTVTFTDAGTYASFVGSGSQFTINDSYLINNITALFAANNYLYIFGDTSVDVLSNVTVTSSDTASFSRVNVNPVIGCNAPKNIFGYYRSVAFANPTGFYLLTGATVENISYGKLDLFVGSGISPSRTCGFPVTLNNRLCAAWSVQATDNFINPGTAINLVVIYDSGRWFFSRQAVAANSYINPRCSVSVESSNLGYQAYTFDNSIAPGNNTLYQMFLIPSVQAWRLYTKLYDLQSPMVSKQTTRCGTGVNCALSGSMGTGWSFAVDTENSIGTSITAPAAIAGYQTVIAPSSNPGNSRYIGFHQSVSATDSKIARLDWMAFEYTETTAWQ